MRFKPASSGRTITHAGADVLTAAPWPYGVASTFYTGALQTVTYIPTYDFADAASSPTSLRADQSAATARKAASARDSPDKIAERLRSTRRSSAPHRRTAGNADTNYLHVAMDWPNAFVGDQCSG
jgi:hypothetical protein